MLSGFFNLDKPFWRWIAKIPEIVILSLLFYICCIPVITIIPAACALFDAISRCTVPGEAGPYRRFFATFRKELKNGIILSVFWLIIALVALYGDMVLQYNVESNATFFIIATVYRILLISMVGILSWLIPLESRYYHKFTQLHANAFSFSIAQFPSTLGMLFCTAAAIIVSIAHPYSYFLLAVTPGLIALIHTPIVERSFKKAFPEDYTEE